MVNMSNIVIEQPTGLGAFTIGDLGVFIGTLGGVITSILIVLQKSHCKKIKFMCWECERNDPLEDAERPPVNPNPPNPPNPNPPPDPDPDPDEAVVPPAEQNP
jgi:hypothetical protein